ncbi:hypothetical protein COV15_00975 [Candidatus Woesearchaeota archaeon CG10_big_fil_rev_8_21_14_0_10_34_12]|nr:MAG: hypothetical protein COV15_00975 [Candidatus Woesearchaeota archaeon CG10_big_fil_rev_8_21_14_0_10_34_12]
MEEALKHLKIADHLLYITYPLIKEKKILFKVLNEIYLVIYTTINSVLQYESFMKRIHIYRDSKTNFETFLRKCAENYDLTGEQLAAIISVFKLADAHKQSPFEFTKKDKLVIMSNSLGIETITIDKIKNYIIITKDFLTKAKYRIKNRL